MVSPYLPSKHLKIDCLLVLVGFALMGVAAHSFAYDDLFSVSSANADLAVYLHPLLGKVTPVLLGCMIYGEDDLLWLEGLAEDAAVPDKETDTKPHHYSGAKSHRLEREQLEGEPNTPPKMWIGKETIDSDDEDDYDLDDDELADQDMAMHRFVVDEGVILISSTWCHAPELHPG